jgi:flagellar M-ring protein FliF
MQKHLWGETEKLLESLDFVAAATVLTSTSGGSPFSPTPPKRTASVQLTVRNVRTLTEDRALGAVMMVSHALEIAPDDIVLTDQTGKLWNGAPKRDEDEESVDDWLEYKERYEIRLSEKANRALADILGPNRARVEIDSQWNFDRSTTSEQLVTDGTLVSRTKNESETPIGQNPSSAVGASSNIDFGVEDMPVADASGPAPTAPSKATTIEEKTQYDPSVTRRETVRVAPALERLSVALFLDDSLTPADQEKLANAVKAAVGYDDVLRQDNFQTVAIQFNLPEPAAEPAEGTDAVAGVAVVDQTEEAEPSAMTRMIVRRGVEIAVAVVFILLLLSSLRSSRKAATAAAAGEDEPELDPELLAQAQVQALLTSNPERVGEILSQWARDAKVGAR